MSMPSFIGLGMFRSGTRWLAECLMEHPQVYMPPEEANFFVQRRILSTWTKGLDYYSSLFENNSKPGASVFGEITPVYLSAIESAGLIKQYVPEAKLICTFRDQSQVLYSAYRLFLHFNPELFNTNFSFKTFLLYNPQLIGELFYLDHIKRYQTLFSDEQIKILLYEDLRADPERCIKEVYRHIGVDDSYMPASVRQVINPMELTVKRSYKFDSLIKRLAHLPLMGRFAEPLHALNTKTIKRDELPLRHIMTDDIRKDISFIYQSHNQELGKFLGRDLKYWNCSRRK